MENWQLETFVFNTVCPSPSIASLLTVLTRLSLVTCPQTSRTVPILPEDTHTGLIVMALHNTHNPEVCVLWTSRSEASKEYNSIYIPILIVAVCL